MGAYDEMMEGMDKFASAFRWSKESYQAVFIERLKKRTGLTEHELITNLMLIISRPIFFRKYLNKGLKQYRRREPVKKDKGDIIYCRDESDSVSDEQMAWGKAVALTMLGIAAREGRKFAFIHFAGPGSVKTELFIPGAYGPDDMLTAAELVLGGGTDFEGPLTEVLRVIDEEGFKKADIIFATDGACAVSADFAARFGAKQAALGLTVTGLLMDEGYSFEFSLESFCDTIYRTSELTMDEISVSMISMRV